MKFKQILSVKKQALQNAELALNKAKLKKTAVEQELELAKKELDTYPEPKTILEIKLANEAIFFNLNKQKELVEKISLCEKEVVHFTHLYKKASLDYEKIKYLHDEEVKRKKKELEKKQALELDEIATMRFFAAKEENAQ